MHLGTEQISWHQCTTTYTPFCSCTISQRIASTSLTDRCFKKCFSSYPHKFTPFWHFHLKWGSQEVFISRQDMQCTVSFYHLSTKKKIMNQYSLSHCQKCPNGIMRWHCTTLTEVACDGSLNISTFSLVSFISCRRISSVRITCHTHGGDANSSTIQTHEWKYITFGHRLEYPYRHEYEVNTCMCTSRSC